MGRKFRLAFFDLLSIFYSRDSSAIIIIAIQWVCLYKLRVSWTANTDNISLWPQVLSSQRIVSLIHSRMIHPVPYSKDRRAITTIAHSRRDRRRPQITANKKLISKRVRHGWTVLGLLYCMLIIVIGHSFSHNKPHEAPTYSFKDCSTVQPLFLRARILI